VDQLPIAIIGLFGALLGVLIGAWRQEVLQRSISKDEDIRRWQQERREAYLRLVAADDELYRGLVRDMPDLLPGRSSDDSTFLGASGVLLPLSPEQRLDVLNLFDHAWRAKRSIELFHLVDDELLSAAERLMAVDGELVSLIVFDLSWHPENSDDITVKVSKLLQERHLRIDQYMKHARVALNVPSVGHSDGRAGSRRSVLRLFGRPRRAVPGARRAPTSQDGQSQASGDGPYEPSTLQTSAKPALISSGTRAVEILGIFSAPIARHSPAAQMASGVLREHPLGTPLMTLPSGTQRADLHPEGITGGCFAMLVLRSVARRVETS
jgi:hypothetical protein